MAFDVYTFVTPGSGFASGSTAVLPYSGVRTAAKYRAAGAHKALAPNEVLVASPAKFTVAFGASNITVTWAGVTVAPAKLIQFQFETVDGVIAHDGKEVAHATGDNIDLASLGLQPSISPTFTGTPTTPTAAPGTNTLQIASTAFVQAAIALLVNASPALLDTLKELADAIADDPNFATTMTTALALKAPLASPSLTGVPVAPTAAPGTNTTQLATAAFVTAAILAAAPNLAPFITTVAAKDFAVAMGAAL